MEIYIEKPVLAEHRDLYTHSCMAYYAFVISSKRISHDFSHW